MFGFFNGSEITLPEQGEAITLAIGFIKGGIVQQLTSIDSRNTARFSFAIGGNASMLKHFKTLFLISQSHSTSHRAIMVPAAWQLLNQKLKILTFHDREEFFVIYMNEHLRRLHKKGFGAGKLLLHNWLFGKTSKFSYLLKSRLLKILRVIFFSEAMTSIIKDT